MPGLPTAVELLYLRVGHVLVGQEDEVGPGRITQEVAIEPQPVHSHVHRHSGRGQGRKPSVLLQRVEVAKPQHLVGGVGHGPTTALVDKPSDVLPFVRKYGDPVGTQRPDFPPAILVPVQGPEGRTPQIQVDFSGPPQVTAGKPRVYPVQELLHWMSCPHRLANPLRCPAMDHDGRPG